MGSTEVNSWITLISIIVAVIGWIVAFINWIKKKAANKDLDKLNQERIQFLELLDSYELFPYISHFSYVYQETAKRAKGSWYKSSKSKEILGNLENTLRDANKYYPKISPSNRVAIELKVQKALAYLPDFASGASESNQKMMELLNLIDKLLYKEADYVKKQRLAKTKV